MGQILFSIFFKDNGGVSAAQPKRVGHSHRDIGRAGLVAACLLVTKDFNPETAIAKVSAARGVPVPETSEQRSWIDHYAAVVSGTKQL